MSPTESTISLQSVMQGGATGSPARLDDGRPEAGKTGTTDDNQAVWFAGYTPDLAGVASIAEDVTRKPFRHGHVRSGGLLGYQLDTGVILQGTGGGDAGAGIWKPAMTKALKGVDPTPFHGYKNSDTTDGHLVDVPDVSGMSVGKATRILEEAGFSVVPTSIYSNSPQGYFLGFSQYGGKLPKFSTIYAVYSAGPAPQKQSGGGSKKKSGGSDNNSGGDKKSGGDKSSGGDKKSGGSGGSGGDKKNGKH
nr:PASTA domain-containing protein [Microlunatus sp. Gsoil 973]